MSAHVHAQNRSLADNDLMQHLEHFSLLIFRHLGDQARRLGYQTTTAIFVRKQGSGLESPPDCFLRDLMMAPYSLVIVLLKLELH